MKRCGMVIGLRADKLDEYKKLHAAVWPDVLKMIQQCHIQNYSIYLRQFDDGRPYLFSYFEYTGRDFAADMAKRRQIRRRNAGGLSASPARIRSPIAQRANGGPTWKKCSIWIDHVD